MCVCSGVIHKFTREYVDEYRNGIYWFYLHLLFDQCKVTNKILLVSFVVHLAYRHRSDNEILLLPTKLSKSNRNIFMKSEDACKSTIYTYQNCKVGF